jgi:hypothetical protein
MNRVLLVSIYLFLVSLFPSVFSNAWYDETHVAMAKAAGYSNWFKRRLSDRPIV